jgi:hypothetical protein
MNHPHARRETPQKELLLFVMCRVVRVDGYSLFAYIRDRQISPGARPVQRLY